LGDPFNVARPLNKSNASLIDGKANQIFDWRKCGEHSWQHQIDRDSKKGLPYDRRMLSYTGQKLGAQGTKGGKSQ
jgi:ribosomal protein L37E